MDYLKITRSLFPYLRLRWIKLFKQPRTFPYTHTHTYIDTVGHTTGITKNKTKFLKDKTVVSIFYFSFFSLFRVCDRLAHVFFSLFKTSSRLKFWLLNKYLIGAFNVGFNCATNQWWMNMRDDLSCRIYVIAMEKYSSQKWTQSASFMKRMNSRKWFSKE